MEEDAPDITRHIRRRLRQTSLDKGRYLEQLRDCLVAADVLLDAEVTAREVIALPQRDFFATMWMLLVIDLFVDGRDGQLHEGTVVDLLELSPDERQLIESLFALIQDRYYGVTIGSTAGEPAHDLSPRVTGSARAE